MPASKPHGRGDPKPAHYLFATFRQHVPERVNLCSKGLAMGGDDLTFISEHKPPRAAFNQLDTCSSLKALQAL